MQTSAPSLPTGYEELLAEAQAEYDARNYVEARALFRKAEQALATAGASRGVGMAEYALGNHGDSIAALQRALACQVAPLIGEPRAETERLLAQAETLVARVHVATEPSRASISLDGTPVVLDPDGALVLEPGEHVLAFHMAGYGRERRTLNLRAGEHTSLRVVLPRAAADRSLDGLPNERAQRDSDPRRPLRTNKWLWLGAGVVIAAAALSLGFGLGKRDAEVRAPIAAGPAAILGGP